MARPVDAGTGSSNRKWYTLSASLREAYDDNVNTSSSNKQSSFTTSIQPSVLADLPLTDGGFTARLSAGINYYLSGNGNSGTGTNVTTVNGNQVITPAVNGNTSSNNTSIDYTSEFIAQYTHSFSQRFNLNAGEDFRYYTDPNIFQSTGTNYRNGPYIANTFNAGFSAQWTPLVGTNTSYSNTLVRYEHSSVAEFQNSIENTASQNLSFALLPKINLNFGAILDDSNYQSTDRGYTSYTGFTGASWAALPSLNVTIRGGGTYTETVQTVDQNAAAPSSGQDQTMGSVGGLSPYGALSIAWTLGARSSLTFDYSHEITPTDQALANGQSSDRVSANFNYAITPRLGTHLQGIYTIAHISDQFLTSNSIQAYDEISYGVDTGISFHYNSYLDFDGGLQFYGVSSGVAGRDYTRDVISIGVRGTY